MSNPVIRCRPSAAMTRWRLQPPSTVRITRFTPGRLRTNTLGDCRATRPLKKAGRHCVSSNRTIASTGWERLRHGRRDSSGPSSPFSHHCWEGLVQRDALPRLWYRPVRKKSSRRRRPPATQKNSVPVAGRPRSDRARTRSHSAFAQQFVDAALKLTLLDLALAQPLLDVGDGQFGRGLRAEGDTDEIVAPPDDFGQEGTTFSRDPQRHPLRHPLLGQLDDVAEFEARALVRDIADDAVPRRAAPVDLCDAAVNHLVARAPASIQHRNLPIKRECFTLLCRVRKAGSGKMRR